MGLFGEKFVYGFAKLTVSDNQALAKRQSRLPADNVLLGNCDDEGGGPPAGDYFPVVSEGVWIRHSPLSVGEHEIFFRGALCDPGSGEEFAATEVTYLITVVAASN